MRNLDPAKLYVMIAKEIGTKTKHQAHAVCNSKICIINSSNQRIPLKLYRKNFQSICPETLKLVFVTIFCVTLIHCIKVEML